MNPLDPCPFCGSDHVGIADRWTMDHKQQYAVWCYDCHNHSTWRYAKETAVAEWKMVCERAKGSCTDDEVNDGQHNAY